MNDTAAVAAAGGCRSPFTVAQWQELEQQALVFKCMMTGIPVPPELLLPIRKNLESATARFYHHPTVVYCSLYGKKLDPEPWRCRRTDGKKWRCSKNAYPDSKYCERHMHRGRNRSRKPVETQNLSQFNSPTSSPSSTLTTLAPSGGGVSGGCGGTSTRRFLGGVPLQQPLRSGDGSSAIQVSFTGSSLSQLQADAGFQGTGSRDYRYPCGGKSAVDEHNFLLEASGSASSIGIDSSPDSAWHLMPSQVSYSYSKPKNGSLLQGGYPQLQSMQDLGLETVGSLSKQQLHQQHSFFGTEFDCRETEGSQPLRSFFNEWPNTRDSWCDLEDDRYNRTSFSTTQLSISLPMASSDFSSTSPRSPNGDD